MLAGAWLGGPLGAWLTGAGLEALGLEDPGVPEVPLRHLLHRCSPARRRACVGNKGRHVEAMGENSILEAFSLFQTYFTPSGGYRIIPG